MIGTYRLSILAKCLKYLRSTQKIMTPTCGHSICWWKTTRHIGDQVRRLVLREHILCSHQNQMLALARLDTQLPNDDSQRSTLWIQIQQMFVSATLLHDSSLKLIQESMTYYSSDRDILASYSWCYSQLARCSNSAWFCAPAPWILNMWQ